jgi:hypothetical protein
MVIATDSYTVRPGIACTCVSVCVCVGAFGRTETPGLGAPPLPRIGRIQTASEREHAATPRGDPTRSAECSGIDFGLLVGCACFCEWACVWRASVSGLRLDDVTWLMGTHSTSTLSPRADDSRQTSTHCRRTPLGASISTRPQFSVPWTPRHHLTPWIHRMLAYPLAL